MNTQPFVVTRPSTAIPPTPFATGGAMILDPLTNQPIDLSKGHFVQGFAMDEHTFIGKVSVRQYLKMVTDPRLTEQQKVVNISEEHAAAAEIRRVVQRLFEGQKKNNVHSYADYLLNVHLEQRNGIAPVPILFTTENLETLSHYIVIPWGAVLVAIDGETQTAAWHAAAARNKAMLDLTIGILVCHGRPIEWARQSFHDLNALGVKPNAAVAISMDSYDAATRLARTVEDQVQFFSGRVNKHRRQLRKSDAEVVTLPQLRTAVVTFLTNIAGVQYGTRPIPRELDLDRLTPLAVKWFDRVTRLAGRAIERRDETVAAAPAILAAVGAMGHAAVDPSKFPEYEHFAGTDQEEKILDLQATKLKHVRWERGAHWAGICGKLTPSGSLSLAGSKEAGYASFEALNDREADSYAQVRK